MKGPVDRRFDSGWEYRAPWACKFWTRSTRGGYGRLRDSTGKKVEAHVFSYQRKYGTIKHGRVLDHFVCDTRSCCHEDHVRPVTRHENALRSDLTVAANYLARTHCGHGHEFTPENTLPRRDGGRRCRICRDATNRRAYDRKKRRASAPS